LIRRARYLLAAAGSAAVLAGGMTLAGAGAASAQPLPSCLVTGFHCFTSVAAPGSITQNGGVAGYYGADDGHTHYRWVQTVVNASPQLVDLSGALAPGLATTGVELCDPNSGVAIKLSLGFVRSLGGYRVAYQVGKFPTNPFNSKSQPDPCIQSNFQTSGTIFRVGTLLGFFPISAGDQIFMSISYTNPNGTGHQLLFNACDDNTGACRQAHISIRTLSLFEFGIGTFTPVNVLTGGAVNFFQHFSSSYIACYSCAPVHISTVQSVGPFGNGGLWESQFANSSSQVVMSPNDTLGQPTGGSFSMFNGSTSI
jgi:hypothetical protein